MGLSGPRKKAKISGDPNNTAWSRSQSRFGQRLLLSQGWTPGSSLGASNASYHNNPGSLSHVRVTVKDDNRGLGAKNGLLEKNGPTGLDGLQDLLGRLNGKDAQLLQAEQRTRVDSRTAVYAGKRWGFGNFVSGGLLDDYKLQQPEDTSAGGSSLKTDVITSRASRTQEQKPAEAGKKKRRSTHGTTGSENSGPKALEVHGAPTPQPESTGDVTNSDDEAEQTTIKSSSMHATKERILRSERKAQRRCRRAEKTAARALKASRHGLPRTVTAVNVQDEAGLADVTQAPQMTRAYERHAGRQSSIRHKKMSLMDPKALNEVGGFTVSLFHL
ncbi:telomerase inhibitor [Xanthoria calcicola]